MAKIPELDQKRIITKGNKQTISDIREGMMFLVDKPLEWTSFDVVNKIRSSFKYGPKIKKIKVGHAGTLDPMATGLLLVCVGKYTKLIDSLTAHNKAYLSDVKFGCTTASYDRESPEENHADFEQLDFSDLQRIEKYFMGDQSQIPPIYSAIKINGETAHKLARKGTDLELKARQISIEKIEVVNVNFPIVQFDVVCSKGTYIRSLAHDMGQYVGTGAYLYGLVRTMVDKYSLNDALSMEEVLEWVSNQPIQEIDN